MVNEVFANYNKYLNYDNKNNAVIEYQRLFYGKSYPE